MALQIVGLPGVSAFLQSILPDLDAVINMAGDRYLDFNPQLKKMAEELFELQDVLFDGERRRFKETSVDKWMEDLKDLLYDTNDLVEEIRMEKQQLQLDMNQVCSNFPGNVLQTASVIKGSLEEVLRRIAELAQKAGDPLKLARGAGQHNANWVAPQVMARPQTGCLVDESETYGREDDKVKIVEILLAGDGGRGKTNYEVVCIVGMGGLGKTTLAQLVFQDERVKNYFAVMSWACVSDVFDVTKVIKELIECSSEDGGNSHKQAVGALQNSLKSNIDGKKFLLVLDDVWTAKEWDKLKTPFNFGAKGSKILVTTRQREVAKVISSKEPYQLGRLEDSQCQAIFNDNAFGEIDGSDKDAELMKLGEEIVSKCGGIPLVAKVIGAMLRGENEEKWKAVKENGLWNLAYEDDDLHPGLRLSYYYLPPFLKRCFEYFALFPSNLILSRDILVRFWIGEGLIEVKEGTELEEIGYQYYNDLRGRSLIQENGRMHDMVHHLACIVSGSFCFRMNIASSSLRSVRHAYISDKSELLIDAHKVRTLIHKGDSHQELSSYKRLRVLDIGGFVDHLPSSIGCDMKHLRYLCLSQFTGNNDILDSICMLTNLHVLVVSFRCDIEKLPQDIGKLSNLRCLKLSGGSMITSLPDSVCSLSNLRELKLSYFSILQNLPEDIGKLANLRFLRLTCAGITSFPKSICNLANLRELFLISCKCLATLPNEIGNPEKVHELRLGDLNLGSGGLQVIHPLNSICMLSNLQVLILRGCEKLSILPESVCNLVNLRDLDLGGGTGIYGNFIRLIKLKMARKARLRESTVNATNLDELPVWTSIQPPHLGKLTKLESLDCYRVGKEKGHGIDELKDMNRLKGRLTIRNMKNIASVEEASIADLKSKKHIETLEFEWADFGDETYTKSDEEMAVRIMEVLEPPTTIQSLIFKYYIGHNFPSWMSSTGFHNLIHLQVLHLPMVTKMQGMVFQSLKGLWVKKCHALSKISMTAPKLEKLSVKKCKELRLVLLPGLWDTLKTLECDYYHLDHYLQQVKATNASPCTKLEELSVRFGADDGIIILPEDWPSILTSLKTLILENLPPSNFKIVAEEDQKLLESILKLSILKCPNLVSLESLQLPPRLKELSISSCRNLTNLPSGLRYLNSLQEIELWECPNLEIGPHDLLPPTVTYKRIRRCPKLEEQLKREDRADWK